MDEDGLRQVLERLPRVFVFVEGERVRLLVRGGNVADIEAFAPVAAQQAFRRCLSIEPKLVVADQADDRADAEAACLFDP